MVRVLGRMVEGMKTKYEVGERRGMTRALKRSVCFLHRLLSFEIRWDH